LIGSAESVIVLMTSLYSVKIMTIRRINAGEGLLYKELRLESLKESLDAFLSKYEDALERSDDSWHTQSDSSSSGSTRATFIVEDAKPLGLGAIYRNSESSNEGELLQMWISPNLRGSRVATDLINTLLGWASDSGILVVRAKVCRRNHQALAFYKKIGFALSEDIDSKNATLLLKNSQKFLVT